MKEEGEMIPGMKKILCATDRTDEEREFSDAQFVANLASKLEAKVLLLHCIPTIPQTAEQEGCLGDAYRTLKELQSDRRSTISPK